ncbi:hypothetical protein Tco_0946170 [Tanacetum coccineum]
MQKRRWIACELLGRIVDAFIAKKLSKPVARFPISHLKFTSINKPNNPSPTNLLQHPSKKAKVKPIPPSGASSYVFVVHGSNSNSAPKSEARGQGVAILFDAVKVSRRRRHDPFWRRRSSRLRRSPWKIRRADAIHDDASFTNSESEHEAIEDDESDMDIPFFSDDEEKILNENSDAKMIILSRQSEL